MSASTERGFAVTCIRCGNEDAHVSLNLVDCDTFTCSNCDEEWSLEDARQHIAGWSSLIKWIESASQFSGEQA